MSVSLRLCLFDPVGSAAEPFRPLFEKLRDVHVVDEPTTWERLQECLRSTTVDAVAINLDTGDENGLYIVRRIAEVAPTCGIIGVSRASAAETIIAAMRAGCTQFVRWPIDPDDLEVAVGRMRSNRLPLASASKRVCVIGSSGGAGATTLACNLAMELAQLTGRRCALVDMDLEFGDVACAFDSTPRYSVADVCRDGVEVDRAMLETALDELPCGVSLLARPERVEDALVVMPDGVDRMLRAMAQIFPFVVVDLPRAHSFLSAVALTGADHCLIVTQLAVPHLRNASRLYECLLQMGAGEGRLEIVLNRCNASFERIKPQEVEQHFGRPIFAIIPNDYRRVTESRDLGHPILTDSPNSPARVAIHELAVKIAAESVTEEPRGSAGGLLGKLLRRKPRSKHAMR